MDKPAEPSIFVSLDRVRVCYPVLGNVYWSGKLTRKKQVKASKNVTNKQGDSGTQVRRVGTVTCSHTLKPHSN